MTKRVKRQIATFLLVTQLAFSLFAPFASFAHLIPQAFASDDTQTAINSDTFLSFLVEETDSSNQLVVKSNLKDSVELPYALYYLNDQTTQALKGELVANSENVLFIGTQSNDEFLSHDWQKMVFKVQLGDEVRSYYLEKQTEGELVGRTFVTDSLEISSDDTQWISWLTEADNKTATTIENVVEGREYLYPFNDKVSVIFTKLPEESGTLTITQLELDEELVEKFGTDVAFDVTTTMENGTFEFDLHLPQPENLENTETVDVVYADTTADLLVEEKVSKVEKEEGGEQMVEVVEEEGVVKAKGLDHMTVFVVVGDSSNTSECSDVYNSFDGSCHETIKAAINLATNGDEIYVGHTYDSSKESFPITIDKQVKLYGAQKDVDPRPSVGGRSGNETIIDGGGNEILDINADKIEINGFTFTNGGGYMIHQKSGTSVTGTVFSFNIVHNQPGDDAVKLREGSNCTVSYNYIYDTNQDAIGFDGITDGTIAFNEIHNNSSENAAIYVYSSEDTLIEGNIIDGTTQNDGIKLGNKGSSSTDATGKTGGRILNNVVKNTFQDGITVYMSDVLVEGNEISGSSSQNGALYINSPNSSLLVSNIEIKDNQIYNNNLSSGKSSTKEAGILIGSAVDTNSVLVNNNEIFNNSPWGLSNHASSKLNAKNNWWGYNSGPLDTDNTDGSNPADNPTGQGNAVFGNVDYSDWQEKYAVPSKPEQVGYNVNDGTPIDKRPTKFACEGDFTNVNGVSVNWDDVTGGDSNIKYLRQYSRDGVNWMGAEYYTKPYTNYRSFGFGEVKHYSQVRAFYDVNGDGLLNNSEPASDWSDPCSITYDKTLPNLDISYQGGVMVGGMLHVSSIDDLRYSGTYADSNSGLNRTSFVIWTVDPDTLQPIVYEGNNTAHLCNWNGSGSNITTLNGSNNDSLNNISLSSCTSHAPADWSYPDGTYRITHVVYDNAGNQKYSGSTYFIIDGTAPEAPTWINSPFLTRLGDVNRSGDNQGLNFKFTPSSSPDVEKYQYQFVRYNLAGNKTASGTNVSIPSSICSATECNWNNITIEKDQIWVYRLRAVDSVGNVSQWTDWNNLSDSEFMNLQAKSPLYSDFIGRTGAFSSDVGYMGSGTGFGIREEKLPTSSITNLEKEVLTKETSLEISFEATDQDSEIGKVHLYHSHDESPYVLIDMQTQKAGEFKIDDLVEGEHCFYTQAEDIVNTQSLDLGVGNLEDISGKDCELKVVVDTTAPVIPTNLTRFSKDGLTEYQCGSFTTLQTLIPNWSDASIDDPSFSHYEYTSFNVGGVIGIDKRPVYINKFEHNWVPTVEGTYGFAVRSVDKAGNKSSWALSGTDEISIDESCQITYDSTVPSVDITSHSNGDLVKGIVNIAGRIEDTNLWRYWFVIEDSSGVGIGGLGTVYDDGPIVNLSYEWDTTALSDGEYIIKLEARDKANNKDAGSVDWVTVDVDNTHPTISNIKMYVNGEESKLAKSGDTIKVSVEAQDPAGVEKIQLWFRNSELTRELLKTGYMAHDGENDLYTFEFEVPSTYANGVSINEVDNGNYFTFRTYDSLGNYGYRGGATYFTIDNTLPSSIITTYGLNNGDTEYTNEWEPVIEGTANDSLSGIDKVFLTIKRDVDGVITYWDGLDWQDAQKSNETTVSYDVEFTNARWSYNIGEQSQGVYTFTSKALDKAGNLENTYEITVVFDKTIPNVILTIDPTNPDGSGSWYITKPTLTMTANDPSNSGLDHLQYQWNSKSDSGWKTVNANGTNSAIASTQPPQEGHSILYYRATDIAGNTFSETGVRNIYWDATDLTEGPLDVKADPNPTSGSTSTISWTKAEDNIGIAKYKVTWDLRDGDDDHSKEVSGNTTELKISDLQEGTYKVTVTAYDNAGHKKSASTDLVVNRTAPAAPTLTLVGTGTGTATLSWNEVEGASDYIIFYGTEPGNYQYAARVGNITQYTVEGLTAGSYFFVVRAVDNVDNQSANSNEVNTGAILGAAGAAAGPAAGFVEAGDVLGDQTDQEPTQEEMERAKAEAEKGGVLGEMITCNPVKLLLPWVILVLQLIILLGAEIVLRRDSSAVKIVIALGTTIVAVALYYLLRNNPCYADGSLAMIVDRFFWLTSGLLSVIVRFLGYGFIEVVDKE